MNQVLIYSRKSTPSVDQLIEQLQSVGYPVDQTQSLNIPRIILNPYQTIHFLVDALPLTIKEVVFLTLVKSLGKATILSIYNFDHKISKKTFDFLCPDALTVSQTNELKYFRNWNCHKMILPSFLDLKNSGKKAVTTKDLTGLFIPLRKNLEEATQFKIGYDVFFDARKLLNKKNSSAQLRKAWALLLQNKKITSNYHLILSEQKINELLEQDSMAVVLADPDLAHLEFTRWLEQVINKNNVVILNDHQATGFSKAWTSGRNGFVVSHETWIQDVNEVCKNPALAKIKTGFKSSELVEPLLNELSRLYTKILHQKASLLSSHSANVSK